MMQLTGINLQISTAHAAQYQKITQSKNCAEEVNISSKKAYKWPRGTPKHVHHC